jgi:Cu/Ag efflux pump CusA
MRCARWIIATCIGLALAACMSYQPGADLEQIGQTVLTSAAGTSLTLANVANVVEAPEPAIGAAAINGQPGVVLNVSEQYEANTVEVTRRVEAALAQLRPGLERAGITLHDDLFRPANFINTATGNVQSSLLLGGALVVVVLFVIEGSADRLTPILMTSLVTALGVLPLAIGMNEPGREIEGPMAVVLLGGLLTSMVLNLLILPSLALRYGRFDVTKADEELPGLPGNGAKQRSSAE